MLLAPLLTLLNVPVQGKVQQTCFIVGQQYSDKFPEVVMVELSNGSGTPHFQYRFEILRDIEAGWRYYTARFENGRLTPMHTVRVVEVEGEKYLRTDDLAAARDDLGKIPEI